jgi:hypothetical protein
LAILAVTASSVLWSLSTSFKKSLSSVLSVLTICWMAEAIKLVSGVMVELGYTQAVDVKLVADSQDNRKGHHGEDNNIYLNDARFLLLLSAKLPSP